MPEFTVVQQICIWALPVLFAITLHEVAHGFVAYVCGDTTAKMFGRLSLNPIRHIDFFGTVLLPLITGFLSQFAFVFGYAKPVPINWGQLRKPRRDMILVTLAGPGINLIMAFLWAAVLKVSTFMHPESSMPALFLFAMARAGILINLVLAFLNLIPIPPLDGSRVILSLLPPRHALHFIRIEPYGFLILIILVYTGILGYILNPLIGTSFGFLVNIFRLS